MDEHKQPLPDVGVISGQTPAAELGDLFLSGSASNRVAAAVAQFVADQNVQRYIAALHEIGDAITVFGQARKEGADGGVAAYMLAVELLSAAQRGEGNRFLKTLGMPEDTNAKEVFWMLLDEAEQSGLAEAVYVRHGLRPPIVPLRYYATREDIPGLVTEAAIEALETDPADAKKWLESISGKYPPAALVLTAVDKRPVLPIPNTASTAPFADLPPVLPLPDSISKVRNAYMVEDFLARHTGDDGNAADWTEAFTRFADHGDIHGCAVLLAHGLLGIASSRAPEILLAVYRAKEDSPLLGGLLNAALSLPGSVGRNDMLIQVVETPVDGLSLHEAVEILPETATPFRNTSTWDDVTGDLEVLLEDARPSDTNEMLGRRLIDSPAGRAALAQWHSFNPQTFPDLSRRLFCSSVMAGETNIVQSLLDPWSETTISINSPCEELGGPPLFFAAAHGDDDMVRLLLNNGASPLFEVNGRDGFSAVIEALGTEGTCSQSYVKALASKDPFCASRRNDYLLTPFAYAAQCGSVSTMQAMWETFDHHSLIKEQVNARSALYQAAFNGHTNVVAWLCSHYDSKVNRGMFRDTLRKLERVEIPGGQWCKQKIQATLAQ